RDRLLLGQAWRRRRSDGAAMRVAEGQVRPQLADRADGNAGDDDLERSGQVRPRHERTAQDEEARSRGPSESLQCLTLPPRRLILCATRWRTKATSRSGATSSATACIGAAGAA